MSVSYCFKHDTLCPNQRFPESYPVTCPDYSWCLGALSGHVITTVDPDGSQWIDLPGERVALN